MIRLRCSGPPPEKLELSGTGAELLDLRDAILRFIQLKRPLLEIPVDPQGDPAPYDRYLSGLRLVRSNEDLRIVLNGDRLLISGTLERLEDFARRLPCSAEPARYPIDFDPRDPACAVEPDSLGIVLQRKEDAS
jgi:hypothetical protein